MKRSLAVALVLLPLMACAQGKPLPRGLEETGITIPFRLDMDSGDVRKIKGNVVVSGRFVSIALDNGQQLSLTLDAAAKRVVKIVVLLDKERFVKLVKKSRELYSKGNEYEREKLDLYESHVWKDKSTTLSFIWSRDSYRLELSDRTK